MKHLINTLLNKNIDLYNKLFIVLLFILLIFGQNLTKFHISGPFYLFDTMLMLFFIGTWVKKSTRIHYIPLDLIVITSISYFITSVCLNKDMTIAIRQFMLFGYLIMFYKIFNVITYKNTIHLFIDQIISIGKLSFIIQLIFIFWLMINRVNIFDYNYFSPMIPLGLITYASYILCIHKNKFSICLTLYSIVLFLSFTIGHASAPLAILTVLAMKILLDFKNKNIFFLFLVSFFFSIIFIINIDLSKLNAAFFDANALLRIEYWTGSIKNIFFNNMGIIGNGFGVPYIDEELKYKIYHMFHNFNNFDRSEIFHSALHNSFITIFFHIGFIPGILIFYAHYKYFVYTMKNSITRLDNNIKFLGTTLIGLSIWSSFNVILELPHSSIFFWLVYFVTIKYIDITNSKRITE